MILSQDRVVQLLAPVSEESPCGPDLEYDPAFTALETLAKGKPESQFGDTIIPPEEPDWAAVAQAALQLLDRSKDLRVAILLTRASMRRDGLPGLNHGLDLVYGLMGDHWSGVHPLLDPNDHDDPTMRMNALAALADPDGFLREVRDITIGTSRRSGPLKIRDIEIAWNKLAPRAGEEPVTSAAVLGALADIYEGRSADSVAMIQALARLKAITSLLSERIASAQIPDFSTLQGPLFLLTQVHGEFQRTLANSESGQAATDAPGSTAFDATFADPASSTPGDANGAARGPSAGGLRNREDAKRLLDQVSQYLLKTEPGSPAPLLIERAKRLIGASFVDIINDLAPDSMGSVRQITGVRDEN